MKQIFFDFVFCRYKKPSERKDVLHLEGVGHLIIIESNRYRLLYKSQPVHKNNASDFARSATVFGDGQRYFVSAKNRRMSVVYRLADRAGADNVAEHVFPCINTAGRSVGDVFDQGIKIDCGALHGAMHYKR